MNETTSGFSNTTTVPASCALTNVAPCKSCHSVDDLPPSGFYKLWTSRRRLTTPGAGLPNCLLPPGHPMASISSLPLHLVADILGLLDNIQQLPPVLLSHRIFYSALLDTPSLPLDILRTQIPENLLPLAVAAYTSQKSIRDLNGIDAETFLTKCYDQPLQDVGGHQLHLTLAQALQVGRIDDALSELRDEFTLCSLRRLYGVNHDDPISDDQALSAGEAYRISRALYRFQIYRNLFLDKEEDLFPSYDQDEDEDDSSPDKDQKKLFFDRHSPWVNEQLACVYDYLETRLTGVMLTILSATPAYRQVVVNGFQWGENLTDWLTEKTQLFEEQRCLSLGLPRLSQLLKASTYEEWQCSLGEVSNLCQSCLEEDLEEFNRDKKPDENHGVWRVADMDRLAQEVDADDDVTDDHPRQMWTKVYYDRVHERFRLGDHAFAPMRFVYGLRGIGYVMWDGKRMEDEVCKGTVDKAYRGDPVF
ncbi:hypothetical protein FALBO_8837 [Fusarium albosuccineum]|uniref:Uncharacterized protein n=1 Tax=Fusarium albosuccineum TaxID=1237068 RepID=A0A8H4L8Y4_9HYPO|nr:hypothetical protein FALBO_8837 [Fusarium albosuccineum]